MKNEKKKNLGTKHPVEAKRLGGNDQEETSWGETTRGGNGLGANWLGS